MGYKRLCVVLTVVAFAALVGLPVWIVSTSITRPHFPSGTEGWFKAARQRVTPLPALVRIHVVQTSRAGLSWAEAAPPNILAFVTAASALGQVSWPGLGQVQFEFSMVTPDRCGADLAEAEAKVQVGCAAMKAGLRGGSPRKVAELLTAAARLERDAPGLYDIFAFESSAKAAGSAVVSHGRVAWLWLGPHPVEHDRSELLNAAVSAMLGGNQRGSGTSLPTSAASETTLSFSLCVANAWPPLAWDFAPWDMAVWQPLRQRLALLLSIEVESRVHWFTPARIAPTPDRNGPGTTVPRSELPFFIDSDVWSLDFGRTAAGHQQPPPAAHTAAPPPSDDLQTTGEGEGEGGRLDASPLLGDRSLIEGPGQQPWPALAGAGHGVPQHVLNLVAYVPPAEQQPLSIVDGSAREYAFTTPLWGGVVIINNAPHTPHTTEEVKDAPGLPPLKATSAGAPVDAEAREQTNDSVSPISVTGLLNASDAAGGDGALAGQNAHASSAFPQRLSDEAMLDFSRAAMMQLRQLIGLGPTGGDTGGGVTLLDPKSEGVALWELDALARARFVQLQTESADIGLALLQLVGSLPNLGMPLVIGSKVAEAQAHWERAARAQAAGAYTEALSSARAARVCAEVAFSHPSIMAMHNYPDQHKIAIYMPLFLPLAVPIIQVLSTELKRLVAPQSSAR